MKEIEKRITEQIGSIINRNWSLHSQLCDAHDLYSKAVLFEKLGNRETSEAYLNGFITLLHRVHKNHKLKEGKE